MDPIVCTLCRRRFEVGEEDPDAAVDDAVNHVITTHGRSPFDHPELLATN